jgi:hypothetical protein
MRVREPGRPQGTVGARAHWRSPQGQALSEYVVMLGILVVTVIAAMTMFQGPVARIVVRLARWVVVNLTS